METIIVSGRYKVTHIIHARPDFCVMRAVDIEDRAQKEVLLNVFEGEYLKKGLNWFDGLEGCREFIECFVSGSSFVAVFRAPDGRGEQIDRIFCRGAEVDWEQRLYYADELMLDSLACADYPYEISCALMLSQNLIISQTDESLSHIWAIYPLPEANEREFLYLLSDQLKKILLERWGDTDSERNFIAELDASPHTTAQSYAIWLDYKDKITAEYQMLYSKGVLQRQLYLVFRAIKRAVMNPFNQNNEKRR